MERRIEYAKIAPGAVHAMGALETYVRQSGLERSLLHLVKTGASQFNGCAVCLDMHAREAREDGETEEATIPTSSVARQLRTTPNGNTPVWPGRKP
jgi:AhpD family alkylhydroperoxidase